jgi:hypothetical protein
VCLENCQLNSTIVVEYLCAIKATLNRTLSNIYGSATDDATGRPFSHFVAISDSEVDVRYCDVLA